MTALLEIHGLSAGYGEVRALDGVTLAAEEGAITALVGSNGAGKTTLMRAVSGLIAPTRGRIVMGGDDITAEPTHRRVERGMVLVPEGRLIFPDLTVEETLKVGAYARRARDGSRERMDEAYALFPRLAERRRQRARTLSGGEQQMLALARGLMARPRLLLLDEPSLGLAPMMAVLLIETIERIRDTGVTVFIVEQDVHATLGIADFAYVLENGRLVAEGPAAEVRDLDLVRESYLGL